MNSRSTTNTSLLIDSSIEISESNHRYDSLQLFNIPSELITKNSFKLIFAILLKYILLNEILSKQPTMI